MLRFVGQVLVIQEINAFHGQAVGQRIGIQILQIPPIVDFRHLAAFVHRLLPDDEDVAAGSESPAVDHINGKGIVIGILVDLVVRGGQMAITHQGAKAVVVHLGPVMPQPEGQGGRVGECKVGPEKVFNGRPVAAAKYRAQ